MLLDRIYRDEVDDRAWYRTGRDIYYNSLLTQIQISLPQEKMNRGLVSGILEYTVDGRTRIEYVRNPYKEVYLQKNMVEISKIRPGFSKINCEGEIIDIGTARDVKLKAGGTSRVADAVLKDHSGTITLTLWDHNINMVQKGSKVIITNGFARDYKGKMSLSTGKFGKLEVQQY